MFEGFAKLRTSLTQAAYLRRISRELHRANDLAELRLSLEFPNEFRQTRLGREYASRNERKAKFTQMDVADVGAWNEKYREDHPEIRYSEDEDEGGGDN